MDLIDDGSTLKFLERVSKYFLVSGTVIKAPALRVDHSNQIFSILTDQAIQFFALVQLAADTVNLDLLVDCVKVEKKYQAHQAAHRLAEGERKVLIRLIEKIRERGHTRRAPLEQYNGPAP